MNNKLRTYKKSGVNINAADKFVNFISTVSSKKKGKKKFSNIGGFGSISDIPNHIKQPKIVACTDGVGTKVEIANTLNKYDTIGIDLVAMSVNDLIVAIPSSGLHSNGYSLVRYLLKQKKIDIKKNIFLKKELIKPTKIYVNEVLKLIDKNLINGCANITGGGLADNIKRVIPDNFTAEINLDLIKISKIFKWLHKKGITDKEMLKTFNCGVGFCLIINPKKLNQIKDYFKNNYKPYVIGKIAKNFKEKVKLNGSINWI